MVNREMKESGVEWIGKIPKNWVINKVRYFMREKSVKNHPDELVLSLYRDYGVIPKNSRNDNHNVTSLDTSTYKLVEKNQLVINKMKAWQGSLAISDYRGIISPAYYIFDIISRNLSPEFLHYAFRNPVYIDEYKRLSAGIRPGQWDLNKDEFKNISYVYPSSIHEQQKIATFLDEKVSHVDSIIEDTKKSIENLKAYKQSLITETVTTGLDPNVEMKDSGIEWIGEFPFHWKKTRIKNMASIGSGSTPKSSNEDYYNGNINWIQSGDLYQKKYIEDTSRKITNKAIKEVSALKFYNAPFITIALYGASIGNVSISKIDSTVNQAVAVIEPNNISIDYLFYLLTASKSGFLSLSVGGTQPNISQTIISNWIVPYPPMDEQNRIVEFLDVKTTQIDNLIDKKEQIITEIEAYKKTLIYEYVTGKKEVK